MRNAVLKYNNASCMTIYDVAGAPVVGRKRVTRQVNGNDGLENELREARSRGHLFARKFQSSDLYWVDWIQANLHGKLT
jgi:hypothetical protein